jgi:pyruvate dehydrogenase E2 component (dihydrolipoamide acetyltransferase)
MATDFKLPDLGENITSGDIVSVLVKEGDDIQAGQSVVEIETDKAVVEVPCPLAGKVSKVHVKQGQTVKIGEAILAVEGSAAPAAGKPAKPAPAKAEPAKAETPAPAEKAPAKPAPSQPARPASQAAPAASSNGGAKSTPVEPEAEPVEASASAAAAAGPSTRRLARELGVDIESISGTGPGGRITREDIVAAVRHQAAHTPVMPKGKGAGVPEGVQARDNFGTVRRQDLSRIRKTIAANMVRSVTTIPHVTNFDDADITELERIRKGSVAEYVDSDVKLTMMAFVMKAVAQSLRLHPLVNASLDMEREQIVYKDYVNLGVAVDTERGLVVPVVREVDRMGIPMIAQALTEMAQKARNNKFAIEDQQGGTFTISNLGAIGGTYSTPIINAPQVAILLLGRSRKMPVIVEDKIEPRLMMPLSLSYDHRLIDGAAAARFLNEIKNYLQVPGRLLLAQ